MDNLPRSSLVSRKSAFPKKGLLAALATIFLLSCVATCLAGNLSRQPGCPYYRSWFRNMCDYSRMFPLAALSVDTSLFPVKVKIAPIESVGHHGAAERVINVIYSANGRHIGKHELERWARAERAQESYKQAGSDTGLPAPPCGIPQNLDYQSPIADQFCAACSVRDYCRAVGLYQDYVSIFELDIGSLGLTRSDFIGILAKIDERMAQYLELGE